MRRNCNLELRLMPPSFSFSPKNCTTPYFSTDREDKESTEEKQPQQLTIFYNGKFVVSDATELQVCTVSALYFLFFIFVYFFFFIFFRVERSLIVWTFCAPFGHSIMTLHVLLPRRLNCNCNICTISSFYKYYFMEDGITKFRENSHKFESKKGKRGCPAHFFFLLSYWARGRWSRILTI